MDQAVNHVKAFHDAVMTDNIAHILSKAFAYCQDTFCLPPSGGSVPKRDAGAVRSELATRKKVRKSADKKQEQKTIYLKKTLRPLGAKLIQVGQFS